MRKIVLLLASLCFMSCSVPRYHIDTVTIDYSFFTKKSFFITESNSVNFEYTPLGSLHVGVYSGKHPEEGKQVEKKAVRGGGDDIYREYHELTRDKWKVATVDDALNEIYELATSISANGIINLKIEYVPESAAGRCVKGSGIVVSGMAIKK